MKWFRGGKWTIEPLKMPSAVEYEARLLRVTEDPEDDFIRREMLASLSADTFLDQSTTWDQEVGQRFGLDRYEVTLATARKLLVEMQGISQGLEPECGNKPLEECSPDRRDAIIKQLVATLENYGPLRPIAEVVDLSSVGVEVPTEGAPRGVFLEVLIQDVIVFADFYTLVMDENANRTMLAQRMQEVSSKDVRGVRVLVTLDEETGVQLTARPVTLIAFLWEALFRLNVRRPGICPICNAAFKIPSGVGRPFVYCPDHRASKFRTAEYEKREAKKGRPRP